MTTVLIIEDNPQNMKLARYILEEGNYFVLEVYDADEGIKVAVEQRPDIVIMDIQLPGMDGLKAIEILKRNPKLATVKIIAITALAMTGDRDRILAAGADAYLSKPYSYKDLLNQVAIVLAQ